MSDFYRFSTGRAFGRVAHPAMTSEDLLALQKQLTKYESAITEFRAVEAELQCAPVTARTADMMRINRETINAMERSIELVQERLRGARERPVRS